MLNYALPIINKSQLKYSGWSKDDHNAHFWPPHINLVLNLCLKPNINIVVTFARI